MTEIEQLITTLKRQLKRQGLTYRDVATALKLSEASVKRTFASGRFTLDRLVEVGNLLGFSLAELAQQASAEAPRLSTLTERQEKELVSDNKLLLVAVCALNHWTLADMVSAYRLSQADCISRIVRLDRLRLIDLLPNNRIRIVVARDFDWLPGGPIQQFFLKHGQADFLASRFGGPKDALAFAHGMLTDASVAEVQAELRKLRKKFAELHQEDLATPMDQRRGTALLLALREWELPGFAALRRSTEK
ncbi:MAG: transcriptional regulator [Burkholderiales bacterium]|nr:transcriptional regulator [Burkholderiales bacterium]